MKKYILAFALIFSSFLTFADAWDNLTLEDAQAVVAELKRNPYIFDYCDCCNNEGEYATTIEFLKVISTEIVPCSWDNEFYSVKAYSVLLATVFYANNGPDVNQLIEPESTEYAELIYMNYTWTFHPETKLARPFFDRINYVYYGDDRQPCKSSFAYPTPAQLKTVSKDKGYKKWYKKVMRG